MKIPIGYTKQTFIVNGIVEHRANPDYPEGHCFTTIECDKCGEMFEADREHICREQNSYPREFSIYEKDIKK